MHLRANLANCQVYFACCEVSSKSYAALPAISSAEHLVRLSHSFWDWGDNSVVCVSKRPLALGQMEIAKRAKTVNVSDGCCRGLLVAHCELRLQHFVAATSKAVGNCCGNNFVTRSPYISFSRIRFCSRIRIRIRSCICIRFRIRFRFHFGIHDDKRVICRPICRGTSFIWSGRGKREGERAGKCHERVGASQL